MSPALLVIGGFTRLDKKDLKLALYEGTWFKGIIPRSPLLIQETDKGDYILTDQMGFIYPKSEVQNLVKHLLTHYTKASDQDILTANLKRIDE